MFFLVMLVITILVVMNVEYLNLSSNKNSAFLTTSFTVLRNGYSSIIAIESTLGSLNLNSSDAALLNSSILGAIKHYLVNYNTSYPSFSNRLNTINKTIGASEEFQLTIMNNQSIATPNPYQQEVVLNGQFTVYEASNFQNVEFLYTNGTVIPSWLEIYNASDGFAIYWLKMEGIAAYSPVTIDIKFEPASLNLFNGVTVGEAPQLSPTYGQYDNGADVFNFYDNFVGTSLNTSKWSVGSITKYSVDNGLVLNPATAQSTPGGYIQSISTFSPPAIFDMYGEPMESNVNSYSAAAIGFNPTGIGGNGPSGQTRCAAAIGDASNTEDLYMIVDNCAGINYATATGYSRTVAVWTVGYTSNTAWAMKNYGTRYYQTSGLSSTPLVVGFSGQQNALGPATVTWVRVRAYPPNGVMPSVQIHTLPLPPSNKPLYIGYYAPITITNYQSTSTPAPFQQTVTVDSANYANIEASNLQNVEFFYSNGTVIPSWLESGTSSSNAIYWLRLGRSIPANTTITVYIGFADPSVNLFNGINVGEAPQLSPTYGQYDDGSRVFTFYDNFEGSSLGSEWNGIANQGNPACNDGNTYPLSTALTINDGLTLTTNSTMSDAGITLNSGFTPPVITEADILYANGPDGPSGIGLSTGNAMNAGQYAYSFGVVPGTGWLYNFGVGSITGGYSGYNYGPQKLVSGIAGITWLSNSSQILYYNYTSVPASQTNYALPSEVYPSLMLGECDPSATLRVQWTRVRAYPPNGVMPSTNIGPVSGESFSGSYGYQYSVANFTNSSEIAVPGTTSTAKIWNGGNSYTISVWVNLQHSYGGDGGYPGADLLQDNQGCTSGLQQGPVNSSGYFINLIQWNQSCGTGASARSTADIYVPYNKWVLVTGIFKYNSPGNAWIASCADLTCSNSTWTLSPPALYSTPATDLGAGQINGQAAGVQMYDTALSPAEINSLYNDGIGGSPVDFQNLIAWLPLDGNTYDYSGNGNTGTTLSVTFQSISP